jgi:hypothetical protein
MPIEPMPEEPKRDVITIVLAIGACVTGLVIAFQIGLHMIQKWAQ